MSHTIAAIATAGAPSAIGILRLSGDGVAQVLERVFRPANGRSMARQTPRTMVLGDLLDKDGAVLDNALCVYFPAGHSYTGEESAEIHTHGSPIVLQQGLTALFAAGARQAQGGEFTKRAFLNGRLDLLQAEAVADLIDAETAEGARCAAAQLSGVLSRAVATVYDELMAVLSRFYAVVDYPDEDIADVERHQLAAVLRRSITACGELLASFGRGQMMKNGIPTVLLGRPNVGKSSLLNALVGFDRAIVTDTAGTTRDTVEERVVVGKLLLRLTDTAGLRRGGDQVELLGIERSRRAAAGASLALLVLDGSAPLTDEDEEAMALAKAAPAAIAVVNKADLPLCLDIEALRRQFPAVVALSARTGEGVAALEQAIAAQFPAHSAPTGQMLTNARQAEAVARALQAVESALTALDSGFTPDVVLSEVETALEALGELTGKTVRDDLVETIFSRFCVGK